MEISNSDAGPSDGKFIQYLIISFIIVFVIFLNSKITAGFFNWTVFIIVGTLFTATGTYVGYIFLNFVRPDMYFTSGVSDLFQKKIFWLVGPQFAGGGIGLFYFVPSFLSNTLGMIEFANFFG
jgi:hypothetical protein